MKATKKKKVTIILELDEEEATWLRQIMQNPINCDHPSQEEIYDGKMRKDFFEALKLE
jgi:hypothetical protein